MVEAFELGLQGRRRCDGDGHAPKALRLLLEAAIEESVVMGADVAQIDKAGDPGIEDRERGHAKMRSDFRWTELAKSAWRRAEAPKVRNSLSIQIGGRGGSV